MRRLPGAACATLAVFAVAAPAVLACTRILFNDPGAPVLVGRTMDWPASTEPVLTLLPDNIDLGGAVSARLGKAAAPGTARR
jgi:choloylglycine hydrolase